MPKQNPNGFNASKPHLVHRISSITSSKHINQKTQIMNSKVHDDFHQISQLTNLMPNLG